MKKIIITIGVVCISLIATAQEYFTIKGTLNNVPDGDEVILFIQDGENFVKQSTTVKNNSFIIKGDVPTPCFGVLNTPEYSSYIILENGTVHIKPQKGSNGKALILGTPTNRRLVKVLSELDKYDEEYSKLRAKLDALKPEQTKELDEFYKESNAYKKRMKAAVYVALNDNLDNIIGAYLLSVFKSTFEPEELDEFLSKASSAVLKNGFAIPVAEYVQGCKNTKIGNEYIDFTAQDPEGKEISLSDYVRKGKYVLLDFWSSGCGPCRAEMPNLKDAYTKYKSKGLEIISVSLDVLLKNWKKAIDELELPWPQMSDLQGWNGECARKYGIKAIPTIFLIDPDGIIIAKNLRGEEIEKKLSELLN